MVKLSNREKAPAQLGTEEVFAEIVALISASRERALQAVNSTLISLYWDVGAMISRKIQVADWGDGSWMSSPRLSRVRSPILEASLDATYVE